MNSQMGWQVAFRGTWDGPIIHWLGQRIPQGTVALDIGASIGLWTVQLARYAPVIAIEPLPGNHRWLERNIALNGLQSAVKVHHIAVGSEPGTLRIDSAELDGGSAAISLDGTGVDIPVRRLDDLALQRVALVKMDVEGFELEVLRGASRLLEEHRPVIFGEFSREWLTMRQEDPGPLLRSLADAGYEITAVRSRRRHPWAPADDLAFERVSPPFTDVDADLLLTPRI